MAPKRNLRPSAARAALIACIAAVSMLAFLTAAVDAQCTCYTGRVSRQGAYCYPYWTSNQDQYWVLEVDQYYYPISCQKTGNTINGNSWWNYVQLPSGDRCYVNDYYLTTGCATRCYNLPICTV